MSEMAKKARAALKEKAKRLGSDRPTQKVDSSTFTPPELLNADVKTGLRPISRRAYKSGGKVEGACAPTRADRKQRKSGGEATAYANAKVNRNVKAANEEREGKKHIGGMKKGGRAKKEHGGGLYEGDTRVVSPTATRAQPESKLPKNPPLPPARPKDLPRDEGMTAEEAKKFMESRKSGGRAKKFSGGDVLKVLSPIAMLAGLGKGDKDEKKRGGRAKKQMGGPMAAGNAILQNSASAAGVPADRLNFAPAMPSQGVKKFLGLKKGGKAEDYKSLRAKGGTQVMSSAMKKGGEAKHPDEAMDKALIKKMVKPSARTGKMGGGANLQDAANRGKYNAPKESINDTENSVRQTLENAGHFQDSMDQEMYRDPSPSMLRNLSKERSRTARKNGGQVFSGAGYPEKVPGVVPGGRMARKSGGRTKKGKTNINIVIQAGKPETGGMDVDNPMMKMPAPPPAAPPIMPPPGGPAGGPPPGMPPMPPGGAPGMPPMMGRKAGGRVYRSYKDMDAGAGSGLGRLEKTEIASRSNRKAGGKVYRSYKDMDAGAGSGLGRLEKTEIQRRK